MSDKILVPMVEMRDGTVYAVGIDRPGWARIGFEREEIE